MEKNDIIKILAKKNIKKTTTPKYILRWKSGVNIPTGTIGSYIYFFDDLSIHSANTRIRFNNGSIEIKDFMTYGIPAQMYRYAKSYVMNYFFIEDIDGGAVSGTYVKGGSGDWNGGNLIIATFNAYSNPKMEIELDYKPNSGQYNSTYFDLIEK